MAPPNRVAPIAIGNHRMADGVRGIVVLADRPQDQAEPRFLHQEGHRRHQRQRQIEQGILREQQFADHGSSLSPAISSRGNGAAESPL